jgi:hypothetical protein
VFREHGGKHAWDNVANFGSREGQHPRSRKSWHRSTPKARGTRWKRGDKGKARISGPFSGVS